MSERRRISKKELMSIENLVLISIPSVLIAIGLREWILDVTGISNNLGMVLFGLVWLLAVYYWRS